MLKHVQIEIYLRKPIADFMVAMLQGLSVEQNQYRTMHRSTAWRLIDRVMEAARIDGPMATCKGIRHMFGIRAALCNDPAPVLRRFMGHASLRNTAIYIAAVRIEERQFAKRMR